MIHSKAERRCSGLYPDALQPDGEDEGCLHARQRDAEPAAKVESRSVGKKVEHEVLLAKWTEHVAAASGPEFVAHLFRWLRDERWEEAVPSVNGNKPIDLRPARFY